MNQCGDLRVSKKMSTLVWILQSSFLDMNNSLTLSFFGEQKQGMVNEAAVIFLHFFKFPLCPYPWLTTNPGISHPAHSIQADEYCPYTVSNSVPSNFTACLFSCTHIFEELVRECRIHLLIYMHCESSASEIKILLRLYIFS